MTPDAIDSLVIQCQPPCGICPPGPDQ